MKKLDKVVYSKLKWYGVQKNDNMVEYGQRVTGGLKNE